MVENRNTLPEGRGLGGGRKFAIIALVFERSWNGEMSSVVRRMNVQTLTEVVALVMCKRHKDSNRSGSAEHS